MFKLSNSLSLPAEAVTEKIALVGKTGSGKSTTAVDLAEEMLKKGYPIAVIDPTGVWWGLQSSADGKREGYPVVIFGGAHANVPLEPTAGQVVADFVVAERVPVVLDLSAMGENEMRRFVAAFAKRLYQTNKDALHLFVDEADEFAPQSAMGGAIAECHGAMQNIVRRGRVKGIGVTLITQRSAVIDKSVLYQTECLIAMQLTGPRDLEAVDGWIKYHAGKEEREKIVGALPKLERGTGWVYSPSWLKILKQVTFRPAETFDSRQTPKPGQPQKQPKRVAAVDLKRLEKQMAATIEATKANDPAELRKQIASLKAQLKTTGSGPNAIAAAEARGEKRGRQHQETENRKLWGVIRDRESRLSKAESLATKLADLVRLNGEAQPGIVPQPVAPPARAVTPPAAAPRIKPAIAAPPSVSGELTATQQRILDTVAMLDARGIPAERVSVAKWLGIHPNGGRYGSDLAALRARGYLDGFQLTPSAPSTNAVATESAGVVAALNDATKVRIFELIEQSGPFTRESLAEALEIHPNGGRYGSDLAWLRAMGVITDRGPIELTDGARR